MTLTKITFKPALLALCVIVVIGVAGAAFYGYEQEDAIQARIARIRNDIDYTRRQNADLARYDEDELRAARQRADLFRATLLTGSDADKFKKEAEGFWHVSEKSRETTTEYTKVRIELVKNSAPISDWNEILESVRKLQSTPGMTVRRVEVTTSGDTTQRGFERVLLGVTLFVRPAKTI